MSLLFNRLSRFVIAFLPRRKRLLILWLKSPSTVILKPKKIKSWGVVQRWWRKMTGGPLFPPQIHWKIIWTLSKYHKITSESVGEHQAPRKAAHCLQKEVGQNITDKKRNKRVRDGDPSWGGSLKREVSKHQETLSPAGLWGVLESQRAT